MAGDRDARVTAMLGPTNTGKTHYAIERMLAHRTGVIGLPLRLLAREVYDRIVALRGPSVVALITGEERIVPSRAAWWVCTVEAMPVDIGADFLAIDEIQLAGDPDRGHVFTDRLLNARGLHETLLLGSSTMRGPIAALVPGASFVARARFSKLTYSGPRKLSRMPPRSAIVGFSADDVYAIAELIRRQKGGAAVVMGALSPRTRNAQVALYQNGDVDYLVATDAIGMGLNLDIAHVAFSGVVKFDGRRHRHLTPNELAQIAGRAGRFTRDGSFGVTGEAPALEPEVIEAIEANRFAPLRRLQWRNDRLDFASPEALIASLDAGPDRPELAKAREADDLATLRALNEVAEVRRSITLPADTRLLWEVCQVPDFRKVSPAEHAGLAARLFGFLRAGGKVPTDWLAGQIARIDRVEGDIDALSKRLAYIRTWTYMAQRRGWVHDADHWRDETRAVEDRLSDALHARLTQRFVDRRTSVLMRRLKQKEGLVASVSETGEVRVDDQFIGRLEGFRFRLDPTASPDQIPTLRAAAIAALAPVLSLRADKLYNAPDPEIDVTEQGGLMWGEHVVGKLVAGPDALSPQIQPFVDEDGDPALAEKVRRRLGHWIDRRITALFQPLITLRDDQTLAGLGRGIAFRLVEGLGLLPRSEIADEIKSLDQESRAALRKHGVRFGQYTLFMPLLLKPAPTRLRLVLWALHANLEIFPESPPAGLVTVPAIADAPPGYYVRAGYRLAGERAIRIDMLERLADMIRPLDARGGFEAAPEMLSITGLTLDQFARLMQGLGFHAEPGRRPKRRPLPSRTAGEPSAPADAAAPPASGSEPGSPDAAAGSAGTADVAVEAAAEPAAPDAPAPGAPDAAAANVLDLVAPEAAAVPDPVTPEAAAADVPDPVAPDAAADVPDPVAPAAAAADVPDPVAPEAAADVPDPVAPAAAAADVPGPVTPEAAAADGPDPVAPDGDGLSAGGAPGQPDAVAADAPVAEPTSTAAPEDRDGVAGASEPAPEGTPPVEVAEADLESFYVFTRVARRRPDRARNDGDAARPRFRGRRDGAGQGAAAGDAQGPRPAGKSGGKPGRRREDAPRDKAGEAHGSGKAPREERLRPQDKPKERPQDKPKERPQAQPRQARPEKPIDPDSPFAALLALKLKG